MNRMTRNLLPRDEIILIGPMAVGKTTVSLLLSAKMNICNLPIDDVKWYYLLKNGYSISKANTILLDKGFQAKMKYFYNYFGIKEIKRILKDFKGGVFDFGATHTYFENVKVFKEIKKAFSPFHNIFLLLPTNNSDVNCSILKERMSFRYKYSDKKQQILKSYFKYNEKLIRSNTYCDLANHIIFTEAKSLNQICDEILSRAIFLGVKTNK